ncbi:Ribonuclease H-like superfamily [Sesbania bispinosa]|nr:Ribonuclease H-like superfamily [Sesbania bispinosa]
MAGCEDVGPDRVIWKFSHDGSFSTNSAYNCIRDFPSSTNSDWKNLWHWEGPIRAKYFLWLAVKGGLKTNCLRWERGLSDSDSCPLCGVRVETDAHILRDCSKGVGASSGCVLRDDMGRWLTGAIRNIGHASITVAELWAFKDASHLSLTRGDNNVWFESDSITAVNFVNKGVRHHHPCFGLVSSIRSNLTKIPRFTVSHIYREGNYVANGLAHLIFRALVFLGSALFSGALSPPFYKKKI